MSKYYTNNEVEKVYFKILHRLYPVKRFLEKLKTKNKW